MVFQIGVMLHEMPPLGSIIFRASLLALAVLAVHVSNKSLDLVPVARLSAGRLGEEARLVDTQDDPGEVNVFGASVG